MAHVSRKLSNSFEGALAGGGDPATSPLYVFGPFLKLIVVAGVAQITFGASVWLVVFTIALVSAMYRLVMGWVTDGSGGSGLSEEEFGSWAVKVDASIAFIEYSLTFLVSMAALVTFIADRFPALNHTFLGLQYRAFVAILMSIVTGWLVNRGPKVAARTFGPATAGVLALLWIMVFSTIWKMGFQLPRFDLRAFAPTYLDFTLGGYARILAVMTGIEIFANLVAAYEGTPQERSQKAFGSLLIVMGTTIVTMLIVGPAIFQLSDPTNEQVSVFTQTMDQLLPSPLPYLGTLIGVAVLLSASAASAQGLQNLALGLRYRHYVPAAIGERNRFEVADQPVWIEVGLVSLCFLLFGTSEETYLAIYAAGVFILLSMAGWASTKRLGRGLKAAFSYKKLVVFAGAGAAAMLTSAATVIIFWERFTEGAWTYFLFVPILFVLFTFVRRRLGEPAPLEERLGRLIVDRKYLAPFQKAAWRQHAVKIEHVVVPLDGSTFSERALDVAEVLCQSNDARLTLVSIREMQNGRRILPPPPPLRVKEDLIQREGYLYQVANRLGNNCLQVDCVAVAGPAAEQIHTLALDSGADLIAMSTRGRSGIDRWLLGSVTGKLIQVSTTPLLLLRPDGNRQQYGVQFGRLLVTLDGSKLAEQVLPYATALATRAGSEILLLSVPEALGSETYTVRIRRYLDGVAETLIEGGTPTRALVAGTSAAYTILNVSKAEGVDLIMMATRGAGGMERLMVGSVADRVVRHTDLPVFLVPVRNWRLL